MTYIGSDLTIKIFEARKLLPWRGTVHTRAGFNYSSHTCKTFSLFHTISLTGWASWARKNSFQVQWRSVSQTRLSPRRRSHVCRSAILRWRGRIPPLFAGIRRYKDGCRSPRKWWIVRLCGDSSNISAIFELVLGVARLYVTNAKG